MLEKCFHVERAVVFREDARPPVRLDRRALLEQHRGFAAEFAQGAPFAFRVATVLHAHGLLEIRADRHAHHALAVGDPHARADVVALLERLAARAEADFPDVAQPGVAARAVHQDVVGILREQADERFRQITFAGGRVAPGAVGIGLDPLRVVMTTRLFPSGSHANMPYCSRPPYCWANRSRSGLAQTNETTLKLHIGEPAHPFRLTVEDGEVHPLVLRREPGEVAAGGRDLYALHLGIGEKHLGGSGRNLGAKSDRDEAGGSCRRRGRVVVMRGGMVSTEAGWPPGQFSHEDALQLDVARDDAQLVIGWSTQPGRGIHRS